MKSAIESIDVLTDKSSHPSVPVGITLDRTAAPVPAVSTSNLAPTASPPSTGRRSSFEHNGRERVDDHLGEVRLIDPARIRIMTMPNRDAAAFESDQFEELLQNILAAGGNSVPISVIELSDPSSEHSFELVSGQRRLHACLQARLPVLAIVKRESLTSERQRILESVRENLSRQALTPFEFGRQLNHALRTNPTMSARALARDIGRHHSDVSAAIKLASLPQEVIDAFVSTADLQFRFEGPLSQALVRDSDAVLRAAQGISAMPERPSAKDVVTMLVAAADSAVADGRKGSVGRSYNMPARLIQRDGKDMGRVVFDRRGHVQITLGLTLTEKQQVALQRHMNAFVKRHFDIDDGNRAPKNDKQVSETTPSETQESAKREGAP